MQTRKFPCFQMFFKCVQICFFFECLFLSFNIQLKIEFFFFFYEKEPATDLLVQAFAKIPGADFWIPSLSRSSSSLWSLSFSWLSYSNRNCLYYSWLELCRPQYPTVRQLNTVVCIIIPTPRFLLYHLIVGSTFHIVGGVWCSVCLCNFGATSRSPSLPHVGRWPRRCYSCTKSGRTSARCRAKGLLFLTFAQFGGLEVAGWFLNSSNLFKFFRHKLGSFWILHAAGWHLAPLLN